MCHVSKEKNINIEILLEDTLHTPTITHIFAISVQIKIA